MGTTAEKLQKALDNKNAIKQAINNAGGNVGDNMSEYATAINSVTQSPLKAIFDYTLSAAGFFSGYYGSESITFGEQFGRCTDFSSFIKYTDTENVEYTNSMFAECMNMITAPKLNLLKVVNASYMYCNCKALTSLTLNFNITEGADITGICSGCSKLVTLDITNLFWNYTDFIKDCVKLETLIIRHFTTIPDDFVDELAKSYSILEGGTIYVPNPVVTALQDACEGWDVTIKSLDELS